MFSSNLIQNLLEAASVQAEIGDLSPILPKKLYLSGRYVPMQPTLMRNNGITHVLSVTRVRYPRCPGPSPPGRPNQRPALFPAPPSPLPQFPPKRTFPL